LINYFENRIEEIAEEVDGKFLPRENSIRCKKENEYDVEEALDDLNRSVHVGIPTKLFRSKQEVDDVLKREDLIDTISKNKVQWFFVDDQVFDDIKSVGVSKGIQRGNLVFFACDSKRKHSAIADILQRIEDTSEQKISLSSFLRNTESQKDLRNFKIEYLVERMKKQI
jgi:hypothetical protein